MTNVVPSNSPKIIVFNGPPRSGKDTAVEAVMADELLVDFAPMHLKFAEPLKRAVHALIGQAQVPLEQFSEQKDSYIDDFFGFTPRQLYIAMSEEFAKPKFGPQYFGLVAIKQIEHFIRNLDFLALTPDHTPKVPLILVSDCGFKEELLPLVRCFGASNILMVHVHREGCTFNNDSRSYVKAGDIQTVPVMSRERGVYQDQIRLVVRNWLMSHGLFQMPETKIE